MSTTKELIDDLEFQLSCLQKEKKGLNDKIKLLQIELSQNKLKRTTIDEKIGILKSEIYSQKHIRYFNRG